VVDSSLSGDSEALEQALVGRERNDDAKQRPLVSAEYEMSRARRDNLGVPVAQSARRWHVGVGSADASKKLSGATEGNQSAKRLPCR